MTAPLRSTPHSQLPASQTAPVAEFRCLYTPDIRKKQKKWHDGYLKFHSFNSRVMVYDQARNFLGDTYYKDSDQLHEGDELTLDKGVMVEVADAIGVTQTDLKPLFEKKPKDAPPPPSAPRRFQPPSQVARPQVTSSTTTAHANAQKMRHKSLNTLLGTPKGPIGKSMPIKSPYEARQEREREKENDFAVNRAAKRQKTTHSSTVSAIRQISSPAPQEVTAPRQTAQPPPSRTAHPSSKTAAANTGRKPTAPIPRGAPIIDLEENDVSIPPSSPPSLPGSPHASNSASRPSIAPASPVRSAVVDQPVLQTPRIPRGKVPVPSVKAMNTPTAPVPPSSPPVSASNRLTNVDFAVEPTPAKQPARQSPKRSTSPLLDPTFPTRNLKARSLRLSKGVKRATLMMCQPPPPPPSRSRGSSDVQTSALRSTTRTDATSKRPPSPPSNSIDASSLKPKVIADGDYARRRAMSRQPPPDEDFPIAGDDQEAVLGLMDQQLLVAQTPSPEPIPVPHSPKEALSAPKATKAAVRTSRKGTPPQSKRSSVSPPAPVVTNIKQKQTPVGEIRTARKASPQFATNVAADNARSRVASPALNVMSESRSRTASASPGKLAALSTGGFRRKTKQATPQLTTPAPGMPPAAARNETVALPPHPLRANRSGPVMTTTELAALLQKPKRKSTAAADPIEDEGDAAGVSPNRKFRRVRSENDAPIPSMSEDWEKRNLPKAALVDTSDAPIITTAASEAPAVAAGKKSGLAALIKKTDPRRQFIRTKSLTIDSNIAPAHEVESPMVSPITDKDVGPWSTEAFDLFDWRPPREEVGS